MRLKQLSHLPGWVKHDSEGAGDVRIDVAQAVSTVVVDTSTSSVLWPENPEEVVVLLEVG